MATPVIGLTTKNEENAYGFPIAAVINQYISAITEAGGAPVMIPSGLTEDACQSLMGSLDGLLFTGGGDIAINRFNGEFHPRVEKVDPGRDAVEFTLLQAAIESGMPFLGICRGNQLSTFPWAGPYIHTFKTNSLVPSSMTMILVLSASCLSMRWLLKRAPVWQVSWEKLEYM